MNELHSEYTVPLFTEVLVKCEDIEVEPDTYNETTDNIKFPDKSDENLKNDFIVKTECDNKYDYFTENKLPDTKGVRRTCNGYLPGQRKKKRRSISLSTKMEILRRHKSGERTKDISSKFQLASSSICTIINNSDSIALSAASSRTGYVCRVTKVRDTVMEQMEKLLSFWIEDLSRRNRRPKFKLIKKKALSLWHEIREREGSKGGTPGRSDDFKASSGWFGRFNKRVNLRKFRVDDIGIDFSETLLDMMTRGGYSARQVFTVTQTGIFWKRLPAGMLADDALCSPSQERLTLVIGGNAEGDCKLKPMLVYHTANPESLAGYSKAHLPVVWASSDSERLTVALFQRYVTAYLAPFIAQYCAENRLDNKCLLLVDSQLADAHRCNSAADNVHVVLLPADFPRKCQPMERGAAAIFKRQYTSCVVRHLIAGGSGDQAMVRDRWQRYDVRQAIGNICAAWQSISPATMNCGWMTIWPECVHSVDRTESEQRTLDRQIARDTGSTRVTADDVRDLIVSHSDPLTSDDLRQQQHRRNDVQVADPDCRPGTPPLKQLTAERLSHAFTLIQAGLAVFRDDDPNFERSLSVGCKFHDALLPYQELYDNEAVNHPATIGDRIGDNS